MTNAELADWLNVECRLTGKDIITSNVIRQWVDWGVLPKASARGRTYGQGPKWSRSQVGIRRAVRLAELRTHGVKRETAVIAQAYIEWGHSDFERVLNALLHELRKWQSQLTRRRTTFIDGRNYRSLSLVQKRAIRVQLGAIDAFFDGTRFQQSDEFVAIFAQLAESGTGDTTSLSRLLVEAIDRIYPGFGQFLSLIPIDEILKLVAGALGSPEEIENSAQSEIEKAGERDFRTARVAMRRVSRMLRQTGRLSIIPGIPESLRELFTKLNAVSAQISIGPWGVFHFTQCLMAIRRGHQLPEIVLNASDMANLLQILPPEFAMLGHEITR